MPTPSPAPSPPVEPVRQRCVLVLPSTGEFDSRTYRIARTLHERGHDVTVVARWKAGLAREEIHPIGYRIQRVDADTLDGIPLVGGVLREVVRGLRRRRRASSPAGAGSPSATNGTTAGWAHPVASEAPPSRAGRLAESILRRVRIFLMLRSHRRNALRQAPAADIYHGMAYMGIGVALALGRRHGGKVLYDSRDIYMVAANLAKLRGPAKWLLARAEKRWAQAADRVLTVNVPYAEELARRFDVPMPLVVMNCSYRFTPPEPRERRFHEALGLTPETRVVLYQGGFSPERGIEELVKAIHQVPNAALVCMGYGVLEPKLRDWAAEPRNAGKLYVLPAVDPTEVIPWVACADVVGALFQPTTLNHRLSTPNKFLEAMAAGVPTVVSDDPGMAPIARDAGCGIPVDPLDIDAIAAAIRTILDAPEDERRAWRERALAAAHDRYNWETQVQGLLEEYARLTGKPW
ncbi:MAG TPA: glycosyltransferase family 4 protein [Candidatus Limnocylindrales bacterium]|nr:glycosyltransferase family 4 protein [Candidatus Limnocylindrales bacterium]